MKNKLLLIAAASAFASTLPVRGADFEVGPGTTLSVSGLFTVGVKDSLVSNITPNDTRAHNSELRVDDNTSRVIFSGSTNIVWPGWKALFYIENRFTANAEPIDPLMPGLPPGMTQYTAGNMTGWANGPTYAGISGPFGRLILGKSTFYYLDGLDYGYIGGALGAGESYRAWDAQALGVFNMLSQVGTSIMAGGHAVAGLPLATLQIDRTQNAIEYDSPRIAGFDFTIGYSKNPYNSPNNSEPAQFGRAYEDGGCWWERLRYNNGGFMASASKLDVVVQGGNNTALQAVYLNNILPGFIQGPLDTHAYRLTAGYKLPMGLKFGVVYDDTSVDNGVIGTRLKAERHIVEVPVSYNWGKSAAYVTYNKASSTSNLPDSGATMWTVGYDYELAKKTFAGIFYTTLNNASNGNYQPFLSTTVLGGTGPSTGENFRQISLDINFWF
jgi:predicted porin